MSLVVIAGRDGTFWTVVAAHAVWVLVSQAPLVLLLVAVAGGAHERFVARFRSWRERARPAATLLVGASFLLDAGYWFAAGGFLVPI